MVANLLARSAGLANEIPDEVEDMLGAQMVAEARITAHFVDAAEKAGFQPEEINRQLPPDCRYHRARRVLGNR